MDSEGARGLTTPQDFFKYSGDDGWVIEKTENKTSDPHVLKQCAQRPQEVHRNTRPRCLKVCLKTAGRLYFL